jgi:hypothetical protein
MLLPLMAPLLQLPATTTVTVAVAVLSSTQQLVRTQRTAAARDAAYAVMLIHQPHQRMFTAAAVAVAVNRSNSRLVLA